MAGIVPRPGQIERLPVARVKEQEVGIANPAAGRHQMLPALAPVGTGVEPFAGREIEVLGVPGVDHQPVDVAIGDVVERGIAGELSPTPPVVVKDAIVLISYGTSAWSE